MTVLELIRSSLRLIGQLGPGRGPGDSETVDALLVLNSMLDAWNTERLLIYAITRSVFTLEASTQTYTIGPDGAFNTTRPQKIERASIIYLADPANPLERPIEVLRSERDWQDVVLKTLSNTLPDRVWYQPTFPLGSLHFWPVPSAAHQVALYLWQPITGFASTDEPVVFPPGYADAIRYNLAVKLAPEWNRPLRADVLQMAIDSKAAIKRVNLTVPTLKCDPAIQNFRRTRGSQPFNIYTGE